MKKVVIVLIALILVSSAYAVNKACTTASGGACEGYDGAQCYYPSDIGEGWVYKSEGDAICNPKKCYCKLPEPNIGTDYFDIPSGYSGNLVCSSYGGVCQSITCKAFAIPYWGSGVTFCGKYTPINSDTEITKDCNWKNTYDDGWARAYCSCSTKKYCDGSIIKQRMSNCKTVFGEDCANNNKRCSNGNCAGCIDGFEMSAGNCVTCESLKKVWSESSKACVTCESLGKVWDNNLKVCLETPSLSASHDHKKCNEADGKIYWYNSNNIKEDVFEDCNIYSCVVLGFYSDHVSCYEGDEVCGNKKIRNYCGLAKCNPSTGRCNAPVTFNLGEFCGSDSECKSGICEISEDIGYRCCDTRCSNNNKLCKSGGVGCVEIPGPECKTSGTDCTNICDGYWCSSGRVCPSGQKNTGAKCEGSANCKENPGCIWKPSEAGFWQNLGKCVFSKKACCEVNYGGVVTTDWCDINPI